MIISNKIFNWLSKITHLSLNSLKTLINFKNTKISFKNLYKKLRFPRKKFHFSDPIDSYFERITSCDVRDVRFMSRCVEILKQNES